MRRVFTLIVLAFLLSASSPASAEPQGSCADCHQDYAKTWSGSVHATADVACSKCMGGDPTKKEKDQAHKGVKPADDPESRVYYKNIPFTCGECHKEQLNYFMQSTHYRNLEGDKLAPDCRTCHGSMGIIEVNPIKISEKCKLCHTLEVGAPIYVPKQVKRLFLLQEQINSEIRRAESAINKAKDAGMDVKEAEELLSESKSIVDEGGKSWHKFELRDFEDVLYESLYYAYSAENQVGVPPKTPIPVQRPRKGICAPTSILLLAVIPVLSASRRLLK